MRRKVVLHFVIILLVFIFLPFVNSITLIKTLTEASSLIEDVYVDDIYIYSANYDGNISVWNKTSYENVINLTNGTSYMYDVYADDTYIYGANFDSNIYIWNKTSFALVQTLTEGTDWMFSVYVDDTYIYGANEDSNIYIWNKTSYENVINLTNGTRRMASVYVHDYIYGVGDDNKIYIWNKTDFTLKDTFSGGGGLTSVYVDDQYIYVASQDSTIYVWYNYTTYSSKASLTEGTSIMQSVYADDNYIYGANWDNTIYIWNKTTFLNVINLTNGTDKMQSVYADDNYIYGANDDSNIYIWYLTGIPSISNVDVTPDTAYTNTTFTCTPSGTFIDTYTYAWYNNSVILIGETSSTLSPDGFDVGDVINCTAYGTNSTLSYDTANKSDTVIISNSKPSTFLELPLTNNITIDTTPDFSFNVNDDNAEQLFECHLYINNIPYGNTSLLNGTSTTITANTTVAKGTYDWYINCTDGEDTTKSEVRTITIANTPTITDVDITPYTAHTYDNLSCNVTGTFVDTWIYVWRNLTGIIPGQTLDTLDSEFFKFGDPINCTVYGVNTTLSYNTSEMSDKITISNTVPTLNQSILNQSLYHSDSLSVQLNISDADVSDGIDTIGYNSNTTLANISASGLITGNYGIGDVGNYSIEVNATDSEGATVFDIFNLEIKNRIPAETEAILDQSLYHSINLSVQWNVTDADSDTLTYATNCSLISISATGLIEDDANISDVGNYSCEVNATDSLGTVFDIFTYEIRNHAPTIAQPDVIPNNPVTTDILNCSHALATDIDGDSTSLAYLWFKNTVSTGLTTQLVGAGNTSDGETWLCQITVSDTIYSTLINSTQEVIGSSAPSISSTDTNSTDANPTNLGDTITIVADWSDADQPTENVTLWACDDTDISHTGCGVGDKQYCTHTNSDLDPINCTYTTQAGDTESNTIYIKVCDDSNLCSLVESSNFRVNFAPTISSESITPSTPKTNDSLTCTYTFSDTNTGDTDGSTFKWFNNSIEVTGETLATLSYTLTTKGENWTCEITPIDNHGFTGTSVNTSSVEVLNSAPQVDYYSLSPTPVNFSEQFFVYVNVSDLDSDTITYVNITVANPSGTILYSQNATKNNGQWNTSLLTANVSGIYTVTINLSDGINTSGEYFTFSSTDATKPALSNWSLSSTRITFGSTITVYVNVTDLSSLSSVTFFINNTNETKTMSLVSSQNDTKKYSHSYIPSVGTYTITMFNATDVIGNNNYTDALLSFTVIPAPATPSSGGGAPSSKAVVNLTFKPSQVDQYFIYTPFTEDIEEYSIELVGTREIKICKAEIVTCEINKEEKNKITITYKYNETKLFSSLIEDTIKITTQKNEYGEIPVRIRAINIAYYIPTINFKMTNKLSWLFRIRNGVVGGFFLLPVIAFLILLASLIRWLIVRNRMVI